MSNPIHYIPCNGPCKGTGKVLAPHTYNMHGVLNHESGQPIPCPVCDGRKVVPGVSLDFDSNVLAKIGPQGAP